jgi:ferredoxin
LAEENKEEIRKSYKIEYDRKECIGAGVCAAVAPEDWIMDSDGKATLVGSKESEGKFVKDIGEDSMEANKSAVDGCPVQIIKIFSKKTGEQVK